MGGWMDGARGFSPPEPTVREAGGAAGQDGRCSSLRGWDVPDASFGGRATGWAGPDRGGVGDGDVGDVGGAGCAAGGGFWAATCVALGLAQDTHTPLPGTRRGLVLGLPPPSPSPFKESSECSECGGLGAPRSVFLPGASVFSSFPSQAAKLARGSEIVSGIPNRPRPTKAVVWGRLPG